MTTFGLTSEGLFPMTIQDVRDVINTRVWRDIAPTMDLSDRSLEGVIIGVVSELIGLNWQTTEKVNSSMDVDQAVDAQQDALYLLNGAIRGEARASTTILTLTGVPGTTVIEDSGASIGEEGARFDADDPADIVLVDDWVTATVYAAGDRVTNEGNVYQCITGGTSDAGPGPTSVDPVEEIVDNDIEWRFLGEGTGAVDVEATATEAGPTVANFGTITNIVTPIDGWLGVTNVLDAAVGQNRMTNAEFRVFREKEVAKPGTSTADAMIADIIDTELGVDGVISATVFMNLRDIVVDGMPPHSVEMMVRGGDDQDIFDFIRANIPAGSITTGNTTGTSLDSQGTSHDIAFTRPTEVPIYVDITVEAEEADFPEDGIQQIKDAIVAFGNAQVEGKNAVAFTIGTQATLVAGVFDVTAVLIDDAPSPTLGTTIQISRRQIADFDTSRIDVTVNFGTP